MKLRSGEKFKSFVLILLIILSFIQVGILLGDDIHGLPINFISAFLSFGDGEKEDTINKYAELLKPYNIIISTKIDADKFLIDNSDEKYTGLWKDACSYLSSAMNSNPETLDGKEWFNVLSKPGFIYEFKTVISADIFNKWVLNIKSSQASVYKGVYKIALIPKGGVDEINNNVALYVYDGTKLYKYSLKPEKSNINNIKSQDDYKTDIIDKYNNDESKKRYRFAYEILGGEPSARQDMLINAKFGQSIDLANVMSFLPTQLEIQNPDDDKTQEKISNAILGEEKLKGYDTRRTTDGAISIYNLNNIYTVYKSGFIDYMYKSVEQENKRGNIEDAFEKAVQFIHPANSNSRQKLLTGVYIYISNVEQKENSYTFTFNYRMKGNNLPISLSEGGNEKDAIVIDANSRRVLSCKWYLRDFGIPTPEKNNFKFSKYDDFLNSMYIYPEIKNDMDKVGSQLLINELYPGYVIDVNSSDFVNIKPEWILNLKSNAGDSKYNIMYHVKMEEGSKE